MASSSYLPDEIIVLVIKAYIAPFESIKIKWREETLGPPRRRSRINSTGRRLPWRSFNAYGLPDVLNLKLVSKSIHNITETCLHSSFGGGLELNTFTGDFERLLSLHDAKFEWIIPRVTHLSFPVHFKDLDNINSLVGNGISLPNLRSMHMQWQMRIASWDATSEDAKSGQLDNYVEQAVSIDRIRRMGIARYFDELQEILGGGGKDFRLTVDYIVELGGSNDFYCYTLDVSTEETCVVNCKPHQAQIF